MAERDNDQRKLTRTDNEEEATHVLIRTSAHGCKVTAGQVYRLERNFNNPHLFLYGEGYVVDDQQKDNFAVLLLCRVHYLK
ncbi:hypothetical protein [Paenibacillus tengchongensis]|uniref:hypothetical protein n=1 Tax=Paenibacillus tengchongensis TaxID=2608684 RepID=UPI00124F21E0|nr:hypothetical protein [Paenibacillus tengchongensis]